ncbi:MAG: T9SS type A sorting domain-containing protein [Melioribacter sp.]|nr:T9SS type A sorting domain-containing protein [Melioribacter sp.]
MLRKITIIIFLGIYSIVFSQPIAINPNGNFEGAVLGPATGTEIPGWTLLAEGTGKAYFEVVGDTVYDGTKALMVIIDALGANSWDIQVVNEPFTVKPNTKYTYTIWAKADKAGPIVNFTVGEPVTYREWGRAHQVVMSTSWRKIQFDFTTPAGVTQGRAPIHLSESRNASFIPTTYYFDNLTITEVTVDVQQENKFTTYELSQNYPNPFNPETTIEFTLPVSSKIRLSLYDLLGREVKILASGDYNVGRHQVKVNASDLASGIYFYKLQANNFSAIKKLVVMK